MQDLNNYIHANGEAWQIEEWTKILCIKKENGSILLAPQMRHILASLDSVASAADGIQKEVLNHVASVGIRTQSLSSKISANIAYIPFVMGDP